MNRRDFLKLLSTAAALAPTAFLDALGGEALGELPTYKRRVWQVGAKLVTPGGAPFTMAHPVPVRLDGVPIGIVESVNLDGTAWVRLGDYTPIAPVRSPGDPRVVVAYVPLSHAQVGPDWLADMPEIRGWLGPRPV